MTTTTPDLFDVCAGKHHGNQCSRDANKRVKKEADRAIIYGLVCEYADKGGLTLADACRITGRPANAISGRFTELSTGNYKDGKVMIRKAGKRDGFTVYMPIENPACAGIADVKTAVYGLQPNL